MPDVMRWFPRLAAPIETARLTLRSRQPDDAAVGAKILTDPEVQRYFRGPLDPQTAQERSRRGAHPMPGKLCVVLRATQEPIGGVGFGLEKRTGDLGVSYVFLREYWGHGYAREAVSAALTWAFELQPATEVPHITAVTAAANQRSRRLLAAIEMTHIDTMGHDHGQVMIYAIDRPTWMQRPCN